jgi:hypothetical protein
MKSATSAGLDDSLQVGRIAVLVPALDLGLLEKITVGVLNARGNPDSFQMEIVAMKRAKEILEARGLDH